MRPFGVSLLMAGYDDNGPQLYQIDPSGSYFAWKASGMVWLPGALHSSPPSFSYVSDTVSASCHSPSQPLARTW